MKILTFNDVTVYQFISYPLKSNMFLICNGDDALLIDPHYSLNSLKILASNNISNLTIILTHEHPDHTSGVNCYREKYCSELICHKVCAEKIADSRNNMPLIILMKLMEEDKKNGTNLVQQYKDKNPPFVCLADTTFVEQMKLKWSDKTILLTSTPGHSPGSITIEYDSKLLFTGDYLIQNTPVITRFKDSNIQDLENITIPYFHQISHDLTILPGHGEIYHYKEIDGDPLDWLRV